MKTRSTVKIISTVCCTLLLALDLQATPEKPDDTSDMKLTVAVGNRLFPDFRETHRTTMHNRLQIGDTDYFFEVVAFYPHFAIIDSTKEVVSLSDETKNVAFKIAVYKNDEIVRDAWAFYNMSIPHFRATSALTFDVIEFEYRGEVYRKEAGTHLEKDAEKVEQ
jgi:hypothetical protein